MHFSDLFHYADLSMTNNAFRAQNGFRNKSQARLGHHLGAVPADADLQGAGREHNVLQQEAQ